MISVNLELKKYFVNEKISGWHWTGYRASGTLQRSKFSAKKSRITFYCAKHFLFEVNICEFLKNQFFRFHFTMLNKTKNCYEFCDWNASFFTSHLSLLATLDRKSNLQLCKLFSSVINWRKNALVQTSQSVRWWLPWMRFLGNLEVWESCSSWH
jgi:hypothetical protein